MIISLTDPTGTSRYFVTDHIVTFRETTYSKQGERDDAYGLAKVLTMSGTEIMTTAGSTYVVMEPPETVRYRLEN